MLEEAIPALWSAVHGWLSPFVLFVILNIVIGTIAVTSKAAGAAEAEDAAGGAGAVGAEPHRRLSRVPSMALDRIRSFNLSRYAAPAPEPAVAAAVDLGGYEPQAPAPVEKEEEEAAAVGAAAEVEAEREPEHPHPQVVERSRSEAAAGAGAGLPRLPARLHKSASDKSAFAHFGAEEVEEAVRAVEARRPATTREAAARRRQFPVAEPEPSSDWESETDEDVEEEEAAAAAGGEVDARADDFINNFRHQLKLQRIDSILRNRRAQAAAAAVGV